jgi:hypothetical protein
VSLGDIPIADDLPESSEIDAPIAWHRLLLTVILCLSAARRRGSKVVENLRRIKGVLGVRLIGGVAE